jgi:hypothetical protein
MISHQAISFSFPFECYVGNDFSQPRRSPLPQGEPDATFLETSVNIVPSTYIKTGRLAQWPMVTILREDVDRFQVYIGVSCNWRNNTTVREITNCGRTRTKEKHLSCHT